MNIIWYYGESYHVDGLTSKLKMGNCMTPDLIDSCATTSFPTVTARVTPAGNMTVWDYEVKSWPWFFEPMCAGTKKHDMRDKRDRLYKIGDHMLLREWDPRDGQYTGREAVALITYITSNDSPCAMSSNALDRDAAILSVVVSELGYTDRNA
jgi:Domain of unknown function (DUF3850)